MAAARNRERLSKLSGDETSTTIAHGRRKERALKSCRELKDVLGYEPPAPNENCHTFPTPD